MVESQQGSNWGQLSNTKQNELSRGPVLLATLHAQLMHFVTVKVPHLGRARGHGCSQCLHQHPGSVLPSTIFCLPAPSNGDKACK